MNRLQIHPENPQGRFIHQAIDILQHGGLVIYPTDTVYGLGCSLFDKKAIEKIYFIKRKRKKSPLSFLCPDLKDIAQYAQVSTPAYKLIRSLTPGPFTFILNATRLVPKILLEKRKTVGIRVPDNKICHLLLEEFGKPIINTSLSLLDDQLINNPDDIERYFGRVVDLFLDTDFGGLQPSTIIELTTDEPEIIREGKGMDLLG